MPLPTEHQFFYWRAPNQTFYVRIFLSVHSTEGFFSRAGFSLGWQTIARAKWQTWVTQSELDMMMTSTANGIFQRTFRITGKKTEWNLLSFSIGDSWISCPHEPQPRNMTLYTVRANPYNQPNITKKNVWFHQMVQCSGSMKYHPIRFRCTCHVIHFAVHLFHFTFTSLQIIFLQTFRSVVKHVAAFLTFAYTHQLVAATTQQLHICICRHADKSWHAF